jgi:hypothetical protein
MIFDDVIHDYGGNEKKQIHDKKMQQQHDANNGQKIVPHNLAAVIF